VAALTRETVLAAARRAAEGVEAGSARVVATRAELRHDEEAEPFVLLVVYLAPPSQGQETWPVDDVFGVRQRIRDNVDSSIVDVPVTISVTSDEPDDKDETNPAAGEGRGGVG
jgi:hypothetical protein